MQVTTQVTDRATELITLVNDLNRLILSGEMLDGFEKYYADTVVMQENDNDPVVGKEANRQRELEWLGNITEFRGAKVNSVAVDGENDITMVQWFMDYTHAEWGVKTYNQVSVQKWDGDRIVSETFYYGS